jgi:hypothetical protein
MKSVGLESACCLQIEVAMMYLITGIVAVSDPMSLSGGH